MGMGAVFGTVLLLTWRATPRERRVIVAARATSAPARPAAAQHAHPDDRGFTSGR
jgi:hypothetical protein